jgi:hypothetical protein
MVSELIKKTMPLIKDKERTSLSNRRIAPRKRLQETKQLFNLGQLGSLQRESTHHTLYSVAEKAHQQM